MSILISVADFIAATQHRMRFVGSTVVISSIACLFLISCGGASDSGDNKAPGAVPSAPVVEAGVWVVMGSSTAAGTGVSAGSKWSDLVENNIRARGYGVQNIAKPSALTYHALSEAAPRMVNRPLPDPAINIDQALSRNPVVIFISFPTNDTVVGYAAEETVGNILAMRRTALAKGIPVFVLSTQPRNLPPIALAQLKDIDAQLSTAVGHCFVNLHAALVGPDGRLARHYDTGDGVHPNALGHRVIAEAVLKSIEAETCFKMRNG